MTLTFDTHLTSLTHLFEYSKKFKTFEVYGCGNFQIHVYIIFTFAHAKAFVTKFDLGIK